VCRGGCCSALLASKGSAAALKAFARRYAAAAAVREAKREGRRLHAGCARGALLSLSHTATLP